MYPQLIITPQWRLRAKELETRCRVLYTEDGWEDRLGDLAGCTADRPLVVGDIAGHSLSLLKLVEEATMPLICLSSTDCFDTVFLSRFVSIQKDTVIINHSGNVVATALAAVQKDHESESSPELRVLLAREAPGALPLLHYLRRSRVPAKHRLLEL